MPAQTTLTNKVYFPDGAKVSVKATVKVLIPTSALSIRPISLTLNWTENQVLTANAGKLMKQIRT